jgi:hypothetical protein
MACWTGRHRMVQQPGMVRRLFSAQSYRSTGVITGFCFGAASTADQQMAEPFFAVRAQPNRSLCSVGSTSSSPYIAEKGFEGAENHRRWRESYGACIIHPPKRNSLKPGPSV